MNNASKKRTRRISIQLLLVLVPMIAVFIIAVAMIIFTRSKNVIVNETKEYLHNDSRANANDISSRMQVIKGYYDGVVDLLGTTTYSSDDKMMEAM